jgi:poly(A) polymerase
VPNVQAFRIALRCIKLWAKQKAIYSNVMGFFGGVAWAIITARVCQLYPNAAAGALVSKFFRIMHKWDWPLPVLLKNIDDGPLAVRIWNPKIYPQDKAHRMPVITPAYPSMCSTHNVTSSTQAVTTEEFGHAADTADRILLGQDSWETLFKKHDFFHKYKFYLQVVASSDNQDEHLKWSGMVESRLRQLVNKLELIDQIDRAHPYIKGFERVLTCNNPEDEELCIRGNFPVAAPADDEANPTSMEVTPPDSEVTNVDATKEVDSVGESASAEQTESSDVPLYPKPMYITLFFVGLLIKPKDAANPNRQLDITWPSTEFIKLVKAWDKFDGEKMAINVQCIKRFSRLIPVLNCR